MKSPNAALTVLRKTSILAAGFGELGKSLFLAVWVVLFAPVRVNPSGGIVAATAFFSSNPFMFKHSPNLVFEADAATRRASV